MQPATITCGQKRIEHDYEGQLRTRCTDKPATDNRSAMHGTKVGVRGITGGMQKLARGIQRFYA
jgi:hypothetical protein